MTYVDSGFPHNANMHLVSLVPRPSHRPVFDCLQYAKTAIKNWTVGRSENETTSSELVVVKDSEY